MTIFQRFDSYIGYTTLCCKKFFPLLRDGRDAQPVQAGSCDAQNISRLNSALFLSPAQLFLFPGQSLNWRVLSRSRNSGTLLFYWRRFLI